MRNIYRSLVLDTPGTFRVELRDLVEVVPDPIVKWQDVGPDHFNILDALYDGPQGDRMVFVRAVHEAK